MQTKILMISLDGATWDVLKSLVNRGEMPTLQKLMDEGCWGNLTSVIPPVTACAWSSFMTGKNPDKHGILDFRHFDPRTKKDFITNASYIRGETLWQILSRHGKKVVVLNLPYTYPVYSVNGILVSGMDTPSKASDYCYPPELKAELAQRFPEYAPVLPTWSMRDGATDWALKKFIARLISSAESRTQVAAHLLKEREWDIAMVHFQEIDYIQHVLFDRLQKAARFEITDSISDTMRGFFRHIDSSTARILGSAHRDGVSLKVFVISDHGFGPYTGDAYPNVLLEEYGLLARGNVEQLPYVSQSCIVRLKERWASSRAWLVHTLHMVAKNASLFLRGEKKRTCYDDLVVDDWAERKEVLWDQSSAAMVTGSHDALILASDEDSLQNCIRILENAEHPALGGRIFQQVLTFQEAYGRDVSPGGALYCIAVPQDGLAVQRGFSQESVTLFEQGPQGGIHRPQGIFVASGAGLVAGGQVDVNLIDMAPTVLTALGLPNPNDMDGKPRTELFEEEIIVQVEEAKVSQQDGSKRGYSDDETALVEERLRSLGYL